MGPLLTVIAAIIFLGNAPTFWGWVGIGSILLAIVLLTLPVSTDESTAKDLRIKAGVVWGSLTGLFIAGYTFCDAFAVQQATGLNPITFYFPSLFVRALAFTLFIVMKKGWSDEIKELFTS